MSFGRLAVLEIAALFSLGTGQLRADPFFTNFGPGGTYPTGSAWDVGIEDTVLAMPFVSLYSGSLTDVVIPLGGGSGTVDLYLESAMAGLPGAVITQLNTPPGVIFGSLSEPDLLTYTCSPSCPQLVAGTEYFIVASSATDEWWISPAGTGPDTFYFNEADSITGPWTAAVDNDLGIFQVDGIVATPEPASMVLVGSSLLGLLALRRRRRAQ